MSIQTSRAKSAGTPAQGVRLRHYENGDQPQLDEIFAKCFGSKRSNEHWQWRYHRNPFSEPVIVIAQADDSVRIVGHQAITPQFLNVKGGRVLSGQSGDTMVDPDCRGMGVFQKALIQSHQRSEAAGLSVIFGFPGPMSLPAFLHKCGWQRVCFLKSYSLRLDITNQLRGIFRSRLLAEIGNWLYRGLRTSYSKAVRLWMHRRLYERMEYQTSDTVPEGHDQLWSHLSKYEIYSLWKDEAYFRWRYDNNPSQQYQYHFLRHDNEMIGLAVTREEQGNATILEFMVRDNSLAWARYLLAQISATCNAKNRFLIFKGHDNGFFDEVFAGFRRQTLFDHVFCVFPLPKGTQFSGLEFPHNWTITFGDCDNG